MKTAVKIERYHLILAKRGESRLEITQDEGPFPGGANPAYAGQKNDRVPEQRTCQ